MTDKTGQVEAAPSQTATAETTAAASAIDERGTPGDVWVDTPPNETNSDESNENETWDTSEEPVGLKAGDPLVVAETQAAMNTPEGATTEASAQSATKTRQTRLPRRVSDYEPHEVQEVKACTFKPELVSSAKKRTHASSHQYGVAPVPAKALKEPETPSFKPDLSVGKMTEKKRQAASGSQYGKASVVVKHPEPVAPDFKPQLVDAGLSKQLRDKASPRYLESQKRFEQIGKQTREELAAKKAAKMEMCKYTLAADRPSTAPAKGAPAPGAAEAERPSFVVDTNLPAEDPVNKRSVVAPPPVKPTKFGAQLKAKQTSRYTKDGYAPPRAERPATAKSGATKGWNTTGPTANVQISDGVGSPASKLPTPAKSSKTKHVTSAYAADVYKPKKAETPKRESKKEPENFRTTVKESPIAQAPPPVPKEKVKGVKYNRVSSSGYGVVVPEPSVPAKVNALSQRTAKSSMRTSDFRSKAGEARTSDDANSNAENEAPAPLGEDGLAQINDLITKAALLDPAAPVVTADDEQMTML